MKTVSELDTSAFAIREKHDERGDAELARKLNALREANGLSINAVGVLTGISTGTAYNLHSGTRSLPSLVVLARLAAFYEVSLDYLAGHLVEKARKGKM